MRRGAVLALLVVTACGGSTADTTGTSTTGTSTTGTSTTGTSTTGTEPALPVTPDEVFVAAGFDSVRLRVFDTEGIECAICVWRADTAPERSRGLMEVEDIGGAFGMVFVYEEPTDAAFWMKDTVAPLSIAYYDAAGLYVGAQDMDPCPPGTECPTYPAPGEFTVAVEVLQGRLDDLGLVPGSRIELGSPCRPDPALVASMST